MHNIVIALRARLTARGRAAGQTAAIAGGAVAGRGTGAGPDARRGGQARRRPQSGSRGRAARHRGPGGAGRREPHGVHAGVLVDARAIEQRDAADELRCSAISGVDSRDWFSSTGVRQRVPWGNGTWSVSWDASRTTSNSPLNSFDPSLQSGLEMAFSQPLMRDRKMDVARQQYLIAKRNEASSELQFRETVVGTVAAVKQAYWTLKALRANVTVQERSLELAEATRAGERRPRASRADAADRSGAGGGGGRRPPRESHSRHDAAADDGEDRLRRLIMDPADTSFWQRAPRYRRRAHGRDVAARRRSGRSRRR